MSVSRRADVVTGVVAAGAVPMRSGGALGNRASSRSRDAVWQSQGRGAGRHNERSRRRVVELSARAWTMGGTVIVGQVGTFCRR